MLQGVVEARAGRRSAAYAASRRVTEGLRSRDWTEGGPVQAVAFAPQSFVRTLQPPTDTPAEAAYIKAVLADKPMGYWPLNEPAGSRSSSTVRATASTATR